jgi:hypothetical protein
MSIVKIGQFPSSRFPVQLGIVGFGEGHGRYCSRRLQLGCSSSSDGQSMMMSVVLDSIRGLCRSVPPSLIIFPSLKGFFDLRDPSPVREWSREFWNESYESWRTKMPSNLTALKQQERERKGYSMRAVKFTPSTSASSESCFVVVVTHLFLYFGKEER